MVYVLAFLLLVAIALIVVTHELDQRRFRGTLNMERARQDQLLNRLMSRNLVEYNNVERTEVSAAVVPEEPPREPVRHLYDATGLIEIAGPMDIEDDAYAEAGAM
jgi:hypothetical protein